MAYVNCKTQYKDALSKTWEQIDAIHRLVEANPSTFEFVTSAEGGISTMNLLNMRIKAGESRDL